MDKRRGLLRGIAIVAAVGISLGAVKLGVRLSMPEYPRSLGNEPDPQKITGLYLQTAAAEQENILPIYGSSELKTSDICTHPANFFAGERAGFQVDLIGRGSCQSLVHAMAIGASGDSLRGKKVVLITAPQSYVEEGIAADLFMGNFSEQQILALLQDETIPDSCRRYVASRVQSLIASYNAEQHTSLQTATAAGLMSRAVADDSDWQAAVLRPYAAISEWLLDLKDMVDSAHVMRAAKTTAQPAAVGIDWEAEMQSALEQAAQMVTNNTFYMQDSYYDTYIGTRLERQENKDAGLSYSTSPEYDDLRCLLEICRSKELDVLFVHVPMNGSWSDYTGFSVEKRTEYYENVRNIVAEYENVQLLDLTGGEYEPYFLCDTMHLGWKGWLEVDRALVAFWNAD